MKKASFILFLIFSFSCKCPKPVETARLAISDEQQNLLPYFNSETVKFVHSAGHVINFKVNRKTSWKKETQPMYDCFFCCPQNYTSVEIDSIVLKSTAYPYISMQFIISRNQYSNSCSIYFNFNYNHYTAIPYDTVNIDFKDTANFNFMDSSKIIFFDTIEINTKKYYNALEIKLEHFNTDTKLDLMPKSIILNKAFGLIQIKLDNNEYFVLQ